MAYNATLTSSFVVSGGVNQSTAYALTTFYGLHEIRSEVVPGGETDLDVNIGAGATAQILAFFMSFTVNGCTFKIDSGSNVITVVENASILMIGNSAKYYLDAVSGGTTFNKLVVTTASDSPCTINMAVAIDATV